MCSLKRSSLALESDLPADIFLYIQNTAVLLYFEVKTVRYWKSFLEMFDDKND